MSSDEPVQYNWTKNGQPLTDDDVIIFKNVLLVTPHSKEDFGAYVCTATNRAGNLEYAITLKDPNIIECTGK